jgi:hypothetical protein
MTKYTIGKVYEIVPRIYFVGFSRNRFATLFGYSPTSGNPVFHEKGEYFEVDPKLSNIAEIADNPLTTPDGSV